MKAVYPGLTPQEASEIFQKTATPAEFDKKHAKAIQEKAKSKLTEAFVEAHLKNVMSHPRFLSFLAACVLYYSGSEAKAKELLSSIELKQQQNTLQFTYHKRLTPEEREIITRSIATTLHEFKALSIPVEVSDEALAKEVETQLKRRVGAGRVNRLAALIEAQTRANSKPVSA
jgi:Tfp pilus assembly ATPase PilU